MEAINSNAITVKEAVQLSGYGSEYIRQLCRAGLIESQRVGWTVLVSKSGLLAWIEKQSEKRLAKSNKAAV